MPRDDIRAHAWTALAAAQGVDIATRNLAVLDERLSPARRREAEALMRALAARIGAR